MQKSSLSIAALATLMACEAPAQAAKFPAHRSTEIDGILTTPLNTNADHNGRHFMIHPKHTHGDAGALPPGSLIEGHIEDLSPATPRHKATMVLLIDGIRLPNNTLLPMRARITAAHLNSASRKTSLTDKGYLKITARTKGNVGLDKGTLIRVKTTSDISALLKSSQEMPIVHESQPVAVPVLHTYDEQAPF